MNKGDIYRTAEKAKERGDKPGYYVVVSRDFIAGNDDVSTVICAPIYSEILGLTTEVVVGESDGIPHDSAIRCDFLTLMFKKKLTHFAGELSAAKLVKLDKALALALQIRSNSN